MSKVESRRGDAFYQLVMDQIQDVIIVTDGNGLILYSNPALQRLLGGTVADVCCRCIFEHVHEDDAPDLRAAIITAIETKQPSLPVRFRCRDAQDTPLVLEAVSRPFVDGAGHTRAVVISRDITERAELEQQLRQSQKMEALGRLTGAIAYDFSNIIHSVLGYSDQALDKPDPAAIKEDICGIRNAAEIGAVLTARLLAFSRKTSGAPEIVDVNLALSNMEPLINRVAGTTVKTQLDLQATPSEVRLASGLLEQLVMNLVVNARDAMPAGGRLEIATSVTAPAADPAARGRSGRLAIDVRDTGDGIDPEIADRIFDPHFTTKPAGKGTGLGLSIASSILQEAGGQIEVLSRVGHGATFRVHLPLAFD